MRKGNFTEDFKLDAIRRTTERGTLLLMFRSAWVVTGRILETAKK